jgi:hypothetical protein
MFKRLLSPPEQSRAAKTVEIYGWIIFLEGGLLLLFPDFVARLMHFGPLTPQASGFLRLIGMLVSGFAMLYVLSGRLNAEGFVFATLVDRAIRRTDHGRAVVFWGAARPSRALICHRRFRKLALDITDVARRAAIAKHSCHGGNRAAWLSS